LLASDNGISSVIRFRLDGSIIDTIDGKSFHLGEVWVNPADLGDSRMVCGENSLMYHGAIGVRQTDSQSPIAQYIPLEREYRDYDIRSLSWHPNGREIYYASFLDIQRFNYETFEHSIVKAGCTDDYYARLDLSPDGQTIAAEKVHYYFDENCKTDYTTDLVLIDLKSGDERVLGP
jgi:hypothetical protein